MSEAFWINFINQNKINTNVIPVNIYNNNFLSFRLKEEIPFIFYEIHMTKTDFIIKLNITHKLLIKYYSRYFDLVCDLHPYECHKFKTSISLLKNVDYKSLVYEFNTLIEITYHKLIHIYNKLINITENKNRFDDIYLENYWGYSSGGGSSPEYLEQYISWLKFFISDNDIKSICDCGCGDWQYMETIDLSGIDYKGFDVAKHIIYLDNANYSRENIHFYHYSGNPLELPPSDLIICKDVLQHVPNSIAHNFIKNIDKYKFGLIANDVYPDPSQNNRIDIRNGLHRTIDVTAPPFSLKAEKLFDIPAGKGILKQFVLYTRN